MVQFNVLLRIWDGDKGTKKIWSPVLLRIGLPVVNM